MKTKLELEVRQLKGLLSVANGELPVGQDLLKERDAAKAEAERSRAECREAVEALERIGSAQLATGPDDLHPDHRHACDLSRMARAILNRVKAEPAAESSRSSADTPAPPYP